MLPLEEGGRRECHDTERKKSRKKSVERCGPDRGKPHLKHFMTGHGLSTLKISDAMQDVGTITLS